MKIGFIAPNFYPDMAGGIEWYSLNICKELVKLGAEVHVFTKFGVKSSRAYEEYCGIKIHRIKSYGFFYRVKIWPKLNQELKKANLDIIISLDYAMPQTWQALYFGKKNKIPVAILVYCIQSQRKPRHFAKQFFLEIFDRFVAKFLFKKTDKIFIRNKTILNWLKSHKISINKVSLAPSGIANIEICPGNKKEFLKKFSQLSSNSLIILYLGRIRKQKGIFFLLDAFYEIKKQFSNAVLLYVGPDEKEYDGLRFIPQLKEAIKIKKLKNNVFIFKPLYNQDKNNVIAACDILVLPSSYESFGQVFLQAFAQKKPVIGTNAGGVPYVVDHEKNGFLIDPWDKEKLVYYLSRLLKDKNLREKMGKMGYKKVKQYRYSDLAKNLLDRV